MGGWRTVEKRVEVVREGRIPEPGKRGRSMRGLTGSLQSCRMAPTLAKIPVGARLRLSRESVELPDVLTPRVMHIWTMD